METHFCDKCGKHIRRQEIYTMSGEPCTDHRIQTNNPLAQRVSFELCVVCYLELIFPILEARNEVETRKAPVLVENEPK